MRLMSAIKNHKMTVAMSTAVGGALYALGEFGDQGATLDGANWGAIFGRGLYGAGVGAAIGTGIALSKEYTNTGQMPFGVIGGITGFAGPALYDKVKQLTGTGISKNSKTMLRNSAIGALSLGAVGVGIDIYRGAM
jgi:hypothetical protein